MSISFSRPNYPNSAIGIDAESVAAISLKKNGRMRFGLKQAATLELDPGVLNPHFTETNINDPIELASNLEAVVMNAGLMGEKRWSVSLSGNSARSAIITLDSEPTAKKESEEVIDWKAEQTFGVKAEEMRISRKRISPNRDGKTRFFLTAMTLAVLDEYESMFERFGWKVGLILPRAVGESNWLRHRSGDSDSLLISSQADGFTALLLRGGEPAVVRSVTCTENEVGDEIFRLLMFYNDRFGSAANGSYLERMLLIGKGLAPSRISEIAAEALGKTLRILRPEDVGLELPDAAFSFDDIAAPAALASLA